MEKTTEINIMDILFVLKKNLVAIISATLIMAIASYVYTVTSITPMYSSTTKMLIKGLTDEAMSVYPDSTSKTMLVNNSIEVMGGTEVMQNIVDELELDMTSEELARCITISSAADSLVLKITATHPNPKTAQKIASAMADHSEDVLASDVGVSSLRVLHEAKIPTSPVSPNPVKNTILGAFFGAFAVSAVVVLIRFIKNKIYTVEDAERGLELTVLSAIPKIDDNTTDVTGGVADTPKDN